MVGEECQHEWRREPVAWLYANFAVVCIKCRTFTQKKGPEVGKIPVLSEQDYWDNLDCLEGDLAPEIRRMREERERDGLVSGRDQDGTPA